jgi:hypothetical protein
MRSPQEVEELLRSTFRATQALPGYRQPLSRRRRRLPQSTLAVAATVCVAATISGVTFLVRGNPLSVTRSSQPAQATSEEGTPPPTSSSSRTSSLPTTSIPSSGADFGEQRPYLDMVRQIEVIAAVHDPEFAEADIDLTARHITIYRVDPTPSRLEATYAPAARASISIVFARALLSKNQMGTLRKIFLEQAPILGSRGVKVTGLTMEKPGGMALVGYDPSGAKPSEADLTPFLLFGPDTAKFTETQGVNLLATP